jgi:hypothetical protein
MPRIIPSWPKEERPNAPVSDSRPSLSPCLEQLELPFGSSRQFALLAMDDIDGRFFLDLLQEQRPRVVCDLRRFCRFDLPGIRASDSRTAMLENDATYVKHALPIEALGKNHLRNDLARLCADALGAIGALRGPILFLVHDQRHCRLLRAYFAAEVEAWTGEKWRFIEVDRQ